MRGRTLILSVIALLLAGGTAVLVRSRLEQPAAAVARPVVTAPKKSVLVARTAVSRGQILKAGDLGWQAWPEDAPTQAYILAGNQPVGSFAGWVAREPFVAGEPIIRARIVAPGDRGFLAAVLQPGMRAVSVPVSATSGIAGFVFPGDRVDVMVTHALPAGDSGGQPRKVAETILRDVRVIAIDQHLDAKPGTAELARTVTLEVTPKQSEVIALASDLGQLSLSLRSLVAVGDAGPSDRHPDSFTMDTDVSRLIADDQVTIIRGGVRATAAADSASAARSE